ncbi:hypothetical protein ACOMHN_046409 [Nucella lapillus]
MRSSLRNIYLGETFSSYISLHNDSDHSCRDISLKADLQTGSQCVSLTSQEAQPIADLLPDHSVDDVIHHEVKELGTHILICAVSYTHYKGEPMQFRKFFKFQVLKPFDVKTKFYNAEMDEVYLEVEIQNLTTEPIFLERVSLQPSALYTARELTDNPAQDGKEGKNQSATRTYLTVKDTRQYLYHLCPRPELSADYHRLGTRTETSIGRVDIVWRGGMGHKGHLQTSQLQSVAPGFGDIRVTVESVPDTVTMETTFLIVCRIVNCCERVLDLSLSLHSLCGGGVVWCGVSGQTLGQLPRGACMELPLTLTALTPGLQTISGLRLTDNFLKRTYEHDEIAQVLVVDG